MHVPVGNEITIIIYSHAILNSVLLLWYIRRTDWLTGWRKQINCLQNNFEIEHVQHTNSNWWFTISFGSRREWHKTTLFQSELNQFTIENIELPNHTNYQLILNRQKKTEYRKEKREKKKEESIWVIWWTGERVFAKT